MRHDETVDWEKFEHKIKELREKYGKSLRFRGQGNSAWQLTTTLERRGAKKMLFSEYYALVCRRVGPEVNAFAGIDFPSYDFEVHKSFLDASLLSDVGPIFPQPLYRYMVHLRHFGFPSPLLDWSRSPFVATFFAFRDDPVGEADTNRSVFVYCEMPESGKAFTHNQPHIRQIGPYVQTHQRHFLQRCDYTICGSFDQNGGWRFDSHQSVFDREEPMQDYLWKFNLPSTERGKVLGVLNDYNLNAFSLFGSTESLLETMWLREYVMRQTEQV